MYTLDAPQTIGLILSSFSASYRDDFVDTLAREFHKKGYQLLIGLTNSDLETERAYYRQFGLTSDCIVVYSEAEKYEQISDVVPKNIPVIFLFNKPEGCPHTSILQSDYSAIYQAIVSCANVGMNQIACVCTRSNLSATREFLRAYQDALSAQSGSEEPHPMVYDIQNAASFQPKRIINDAAAKGYQGILASTAAITNRLLDYLIFYNHKKDSKPLALIGYGSIGNQLADHMYVDTITYQHNQITDLIIQQVIYQINHPNSCLVRDYTVKSTLTMHTYSEAPSRS